MNRRVEEIVQYASDAILSLDQNGKIILFNSAAERLFGYSRAEVTGRGLDLLLPERIKKQHSGLIDGFGQAPEIARQMARRTPVTGLAKDGSEIHLDISIQKHPSDSEYCFTAICRDVTTSLSISRDLAASEARLARAQAIAHLGNWEWNIATGGLAWSDEIYRIFGREPQEFEPTYEAFLDTIHTDDRQRVSDAVNDSVENDTPYSIIHRIVRPDGEERVVQEIGQVQRDGNGDAIRMDGTVQDITGAWHTGQELITATQKARQAERTKSQFMSIMSHELRTPLNAIIGFAELIDMQSGSDVDTKYQSYANNISRSGQHLLTIIDDILQFTDLDAHRAASKPAHFKASTIIDNSRDMIESDAKKKNIKIVSRVSDDLPPLFLDPIHCRQILMNLVSNAVKFSDEGSTITISMERQGDEIVLAVEDQGIGMSEEEIDLIFNPFAQGNMEISRPYQGIGLGLAIVRTLAELHNGRVEVTSKPGQGSKFSVHCPINEEEAAPQFSNGHSATR